MKKRTTLIILVAVLVVGIGGYFLVSALTGQPETAPEETTPQKIAELDAGTITAMRWQFLGEDLRLEKQGDAWTYPADDAFPLTASVPTAMVTAAAGLQAVETVNGAGELSEYGLDEPGLTVVITTADGSETTFTVGSYNSFKEAYYLQMNGGTDTLWLVDGTFPDAFAYTLFDMIEMESIPTITYVQQVEITANGETLLLQQPEDTAALGTDEKTVWFTEVEDALKPLDATKVATLYNLLAEMAWQSCVAYNATDADLPTCGLDEPAITATLNYEIRTSQPTGETDEDGSEITEEVVTPLTFTLIIGGESDDGGRYAKMPGSPMVYTISAELANSLQQASYATLMADTE